VKESFWEAGLILRVLAGSRAHGLATEASDTDTRGVCIPPARYLVGLCSFEQHSDESGDHVVYALAKFVRLALAGNPNIIEALYVDDRHVMQCTEAGERLRTSRGMFLTRTVGERFVRYALDQLRRIERHHRWLAAPPPGKPTQAQWGAVRDESRWRFPHTDAERGYRSALKEWQQYEQWRANRNPERAALEQAHGYDTKHAMHLCRLLRMGLEILERGEVVVDRPDAEWLRSVRDGALTYEELLAWAHAQAGRLPATIESSPLPEEPERDAAEHLVIDLHLAALEALIR
jgi:uncharacterized protein